MKTFRLFTCLLAVVALSLGFTACDDEDDNDVALTEANVIGKWYLTHASGYDKGPDIPTNEESWEETLEYGVVYVELKADHTYVSVSTVENDVIGNGKGTWALSGEVLTFSVDQYHTLYTIKSLTSKEFVIEGYEKIGKHEAYVLMTMKR